MPARRAASLVLMLTAGATPTVAAQSADISFSPYASFLAPTGKSPPRGCFAVACGQPWLRAEAERAIGAAEHEPWRRPRPCLDSSVGGRHRRCLRAERRTVWFKPHRRDVRVRRARHGRSRYRRRAGCHAELELRYRYCPPARIGGRSLRRLTLEDAAVRAADRQTPSRKNERDSRGSDTPPSRCE